jgi:hypothetical protein
LKQPWLAAIEINHALKVGGLCFTDAPNAFQLHAKPWDFWRYTPWTWQQLFSSAAGFEIISVGKYIECSVVPIIMRDWNNQQMAAEGGAWLGTSCLARKVAETSLSWSGYSAVEEIRYPYISDQKITLG